MRKFFIVCLIALLHQVSFAQSSEQIEVMKKMAELRTAILGKDSVALSKLLANDVTYSHTNGLVQTKAEFIHSVMSGEQDYKKITPSDMKVRVYENTGIVTMKSDVSLLFQGKPLDISMTILLVWRKDKDWKLVARQSTKL